MKRIIVLSFICAIGIIACSKKTIPATSPTSDVVKEEKTKSQAETQADIDKKMDDTAKPTAPASVMTQMDHGKTLFTTKCASCHAMKNPGDFTTVQWDNILKTMIPKAKLSAAEEKQVTDYIKANARQ